MSEAQIRQRIDHGECPYCGHGDIYEDKQEWPDGREMFQWRACSGCGRDWKEVFVFRKIVLDGDVSIRMDEN